MDRAGKAGVTHSCLVIAPEHLTDNGLHRRWLMDAWNSMAMCMPFCVYARLLAYAVVPAKNKQKFMESDPYWLFNN